MAANVEGGTTGDDVRLPCLNGVRAVAALSIVLYHTAVRTIDPLGTAGAVLHRCDLGVLLFFVLSGFLLYRPFVVRLHAGTLPPDLRRYALRRAIRIYPPYWIVLTATVAVLGFSRLSTWGSMMAHASLTHHYFVEYFFGQGLDQSWTLSIELTFYCLLPLYAAAVARGARVIGTGASETVGLLTIFLLGMAAQVAVQCHVALPTWVRVLPVNAPLFALGMSLAVGSVRAEEAGGASPTVGALVRRPGWLLAIAGAAFASEVLLLYGIPTVAWTPFQWVGRFILGGILSLAVVTIAVLGPQDVGLARRVLRHPVVAWLGTVSYGIYLWHQTVLTAVFRGLLDDARGAAPFGFLLATGVPLSVLAAAVSWYLVERPLLAWAHRR